MKNILFLSLVCMWGVSLRAMAMPDEVAAIDIFLNRVRAQDRLVLIPVAPHIVAPADLLFLLDAIDDDADQQQELDEDPPVLEEVVGVEDVDAE